MVPTRSDTNRPVLSQKIDRGWKFWIKKVEEFYYPCSENKGADQLRSYCEADLRLCFRLCRLLVFPWGGSYLDSLFQILKETEKTSLDEQPKLRTKWSKIQPMPACDVLMLFRRIRRIFKELNQPTAYDKFIKSLTFFFQLQPIFIPG